MTKRANQTISFLQRNLSPCPRDIKEASNMYTTLVRPQLEYAATVWDSPTQTGINKVEAVQRRAARFCQNDYCREQCKTVMMYRIINNLVDIPAEKYLIHSGTSTRGHETRFLVPYCSVNAYKSSFFPSAIRLWNSLPASAVTTLSHDAFKSCIGVVGG